MRPDFGSAARPENTEASHFAATAANKTPPPISTQEFTTPPKQPSKPAHTPGSASKRKHRKLAVNFDAAKVTDWSSDSSDFFSPPGFMVNMFFFKYNYAESGEHGEEPEDLIGC